MVATANVMLANLQKTEELPLSTMICSPPYVDPLGDDLTSEFEGLQARYCVLKMLVSKACSSSAYHSICSFMQVAIGASNPVRTCQSMKSLLCFTKTDVQWRTVAGNIS